MKRTLNVASFIAVSACLLMAMPGIDIGGTWTGEVRGQEGGTGKVRFVLHQEGDRISGTAGALEKENPGHIYDAKLEGSRLTFAADDTDESEGLKLTYHFDLNVTNGQMTGKAHGRSGERSWTLEISMTRDR